MPAPVKKLLKVGFNARQAIAIQTVGSAPPPLRRLMRAGFTLRQARVLLTATNVAPPLMRDLLVVAKFTRPQSQLIRATS